MAKVLFGAGTVDMRDKVQGWVYSKNRYGSYVRAKVTPVNPQSTHQQNARQQLAQLSSAWRGITEAQRQAWRDAAPNFQLTDIFGNPIQLAGNVLFIRMNLNLYTAGKSQIDSPPLPEAMPDFYATDLTADSGSPKLDLDVSETSIPSGFALAVYATPNVGPGQNFVKNRLRLIGTESVTSGTADIESDWSSRFGNLVKGQKVVARCRLINETTGQAGIPSQAQAIVT